MEEMGLEKSKSISMDVALSFTRHLFSKEDYRDKNLIFSPLSLHAALSVIAAGSEGRTLAEVLSFLRLDSVDHLTTFFAHFVTPLISHHHHLSFANAMFADNSVSLSHSFKQLVSTHYNSTLASLDFQTQGDHHDHDQVLGEANSWIEKETNGLITQLLPPGAVTNLTRLIFANALNFQCLWKHKFDNFLLKLQFYLLDGTPVDASFMRMEKKRYQYIRAFDDFKILRLPYKRGRDSKCRFSMCIFLPDKHNGLPALIEKITSRPGYLKGKLPRRKVRVRSFYIPKFSFSFSFEASNALKEVGVVSPFSDSAADLTKMGRVEVNTDLPNPKLHVESIFHKAFIEVNEKGTTATAGNLGFLGVPMCAHIRPIIDFVANHPFLFLIRDDVTGTILFVGQVLNPTPVVKKKYFRRSEIAKLLGQDDDKPEVPSKRESSNIDNSNKDDYDDDKPEVPSKRERSNIDDSNKDDSDDDKPEVPSKRESSNIDNSNKDDSDDDKLEVPSKRERSNIDNSNKDDSDVDKPEVPSKRKRSNIDDSNKDD